MATTKRTMNTTAIHFQEEVFCDIFYTQFSKGFFSIKTLLFEISHKVKGSYIS
ncbi:hypothetical protein [Caldisphaera sp.]|uniref:hypothetical protein n=1 Tax=Caldisphaera sp. TaxID=2060322 RepID=UPI00397AE16F